MPRASSSPLLTPFPPLPPHSAPELSAPKAGDSSPPPLAWLRYCCCSEDSALGHVASAVERAGVLAKKVPGSLG